MQRNIFVISCIALIHVACSARPSAPHPPPSPSASAARIEAPPPKPIVTSQPTGVAEKPPEPPPAPRPPPAIDAPTARAAADGVFKEFVTDYAEPALDGPGSAPVCDEAGCAWKFDVSVAGRSERTSIGSLWVDASSKEVLWEPNDGKNKRWKLEEHRVYKKRAEAVIKAAGALPEVKAYCARVKAQKLSCILYIAEDPASTAPCPKQPGIDDPCLFGVYVGELHADHASRFTTVLVDPNSLAVIGVSEFACGSMPLAKWRARLKKPSAEECP